MEGSASDRREYVQSLERGLAVIQAFGPDRPSMTLTEVAEQTGMTRAAARRFLLTLEELGFVGSDGRRFSLRPQVLSLGYAYLSAMSWWQIAQPFMEDVAKRLRESCSASVLDGTDIVYVARVPTSRIMTINLAVGTHLPAYCTSMGRVLLAHLPPERLDEYFRRARPVALTERTVTSEAALRDELQTVRRQGFSLVDQELETGVRSLAVPIRDRRGETVAAMNIGSHVARSSERQMLEEFLPVLLEAAGKITGDLPR